MPKLRTISRNYLMPSTSRTPSWSDSSTGGRRWPAFLGRHGWARFETVLISAVPPLMLKTEKNPTGQPVSAFEKLRASRDASQCLRPDGTLPFYGYKIVRELIGSRAGNIPWLDNACWAVQSSTTASRHFRRRAQRPTLEKIAYRKPKMHRRDRLFSLRRSHEV